jgi:hypothetical protein
MVLTRSTVAKRRGAPGRFDRLPRAQVLAYGRQGTRTIMERADDYAFTYAPFIRAAVRDVGHNYRQVANWLTRERIPAQCNGRWAARSVNGDRRSFLRMGDGYRLGRSPSQSGAGVSVGIVTATAFFLLDATHSYAQTSAPEIPDAVYSAAIKAIFVLFVLAVVLESALAVVFNWRPFVETFNPRAVRPLVALVVALIVVKVFDLDITTSLVNAITGRPYGASPTGTILTALVIAGGSAGVNHMLVALGYRELKTPETTPKPPPTKAWMAVRAKRLKAKAGDIEVFLGRQPAAGAANRLPPRVGTIPGSTGGNLLAYFLSDRGRFPRYGGFELDPASGPYAVVLRGTDGTLPVETSWGPQDVAAGAIVNITIEV